jgi:hypothetical protein
MRGLLSGKQPLWADGGNPEVMIRVSVTSGRGIPFESGVGLLKLLKLDVYCSPRYSGLSPVVVSSIANTCWRACKSHPIIRISASFGPSTVRVNTETVYSDRREAGVVMASICLILKAVTLKHEVQTDLAANF